MNYLLEFLMTTYTIVLPIILSYIVYCLKRANKKRDEKDEKMDAVVTALKVMMVDRVRHVGRSCIKDGEITLETKETINDMYRSYKALGGNGHLKTIMEEVNELKVI